MGYVAMTRKDLPFAHAVGMVNDGLGAGNVAKAGRKPVEHLIRGVGLKSTNVNIGDPIWILKSLV